MKKSFKALTVILLLCFAFILCSCSGAGDGDFVKPSTKVLSGNYSDVYTVVGKNIIAKDKDGYARLFTENGKGLSAKYGNMEFYEGRGEAKDCIIAYAGGFGYILDAKTGAQSAGPFYGLHRLNSLYFRYYTDPLTMEMALIYMQDLSIVNYENKPFLFNSYDYGNYNDAVLVNSDKYGGMKKYFILGGRVITDIGNNNPISIYYYSYPYYEYDELYYIPKDSNAGSLYARGVKLTDYYNIPYYSWSEYFIRYYDGKDIYYFISAEKTGNVQNKYCVLTYKVGERQINEVFSGTSSINFYYSSNVYMAYQYALIGGTAGKLINLITGAVICENASDIYAINIQLTKNGSIAAEEIKACRYRNRSDNKYHIIGIDGAKISVSDSSWYAYADGKFIVSQGAGTGVTFGGKTYSYAYTVGRSIIQAQNNDWTYDLYNAGGALIMEKITSCYSYVNSYDNFEHYIIKYKNSEGESRARFYVKGKGLSDEFYDCQEIQISNSYYVNLYNIAGGEKARIASAVTSVKKLQEQGKENKTEYPQYKLFDLNAFKLIGGEADSFSASAVAASINNEAKILIIGTKYSFDSNNKKETADLTLDFLNTGKSFEIKGSKDKTLSSFIFTGITAGFTFSDNNKGGIYTEVYGDNGKKVKTIKDFALCRGQQAYFAAKDRPYTIFIDDAGNYGVYDKFFKITVKPVYSGLEITRQGAVFATKGEAFFGILSLEGKELLAPKQMGIGSGIIGPFAIVITDSIQCVMVYDGSGKKLFDKAYDFDYLEAYKLKEDKEDESAPDYMEIGTTSQKENTTYYKVHDGKYWRIIKTVE